MSARLQVSVDDAIFVHIIHSLEHLLDKIRCVLFGVAAFGNYSVEKLATRNALK